MSNSESALGAPILIPNIVEFSVYEQEATKTNKNEFETRDSAIVQCKLKIYSVFVVFFSCSL